MLSFYSRNVIISPWIHFVKNSLDELGLLEYFIKQKIDNMSHFKSLVKSRLHDQFVQQWFNTIENSPKCLVYRMYKIIIVFRYTLIYYHITLLKCCVNLG